MKPIDHSTLDPMPLARRSDYPVDPRLLHRWSPRAFADRRLPERDLLTLLEAARWAPSAYNAQPWRFLYALHGDAHWQDYLALLDPFNAAWAKRAGALIFLLSSRVVPGSEPPRPCPTHSFDSGAAWMHIALQAQAMGYHTHAIGGILRAQAQLELAVPDDLQLEIGIAVGTIASPAELPPALREREQPSQRLPLAQLVHAGRYRS